MYFKVSIRTNPLTGNPDGYYRLIESYRNADGRVCHRTLLNVGFMDEIQPEELNGIQKILNHKCQLTHTELFPHEYEKESPVIKKWVSKLYARLLSERKIDVPVVECCSNKSESFVRDWQTIDLNSMRHRDIREVGSEWLCYQALDQLGMRSFLSSRLSWSAEDVCLALTHIISRAVYPASELKTCRWIQENSSVTELTGFPVDKITKDRLYSISRLLYGIKDSLETYLSHRTNELFDIQDKIIIMDLTNTYFEGTKYGSELAQFGRSKEKRNDAKLVVLALVINPFGFIKYSSILQGNISDPSTLEDTILNLRERTSTTAEKALVVIDAGIATKANLAKIREKGFDYLCVTRTCLKEYKLVDGEDCLTVEDNRKRKIHLQKVTPTNAGAEETDYYLRVESQAKQKKEWSMNNHFRDGYIKGLTAISEGLRKKSGIKKENRVHERVGRLKQKYPSIHKYYQIDYQVEEIIKGKKKKTAERIVTSMNWKLKPEADKNATCGVYFLQTSLDNENRILWDSYNTIRDVEQTFAVLKSELDMRPIFHQKDENTMAHLHLAILAYWVVNTIRHQLKKEGITCQWNEIVRIMNTQKAVTTIAQNKSDEIIQIRRCSEPNEKVKAIYHAMKYKSTPFKKKKFVVHKSKLKNFEEPNIQPFSSG
jgi:hypothetical protein